MRTPLALFDDISKKLQTRSQTSTTNAMDELTDELREIRSNTSSEDWSRTISIGREHELRGLVHQDPFTRWSFYKPKGYPGDANLIDFIYGEGIVYRNELSNSTHLGKAIFTRNRMVPACLAVRFRKDFIAEKIGTVLKLKDDVRILSVAAGHLREANHIHWVGVENLNAFIALDHDKNALKTISESDYHSRVIPTDGSVRGIITCRFEQNEFDLIYALGLYDYLTNRTAQMLQASLFDRLRPGGELIVANFLPNPADVGYMEVYKDWSLIYRDIKGMLNLCNKIPDILIHNVEHFIEPSGQIIFLTLTRK